MEEHYCVRWKGFHSNILSALEDLKADEEFVDVTLSCEGQTIQGHKVILSASSPYFRKILKDNPCRHPVLILNDIHVDVLEALMTYMYQGTVSLPHHKLQIFLKTAEALKIKGIVDCMDTEETASSIAATADDVLRRHSTASSSAASSMGDQVGAVVADVAMVPLSLADQQTCSTMVVDTAAVSPPLPPPPAVILPPRIQPQQLQHPAGDLSLLATAAASALAAAKQQQHQQQPQKEGPMLVLDYAGRGAVAAASTVLPPNPKRRKTAPRKLGSFLSSSPAHEPFSPVGEDDLMAGDTEKENKSLLSLALTAKDITNISSLAYAATNNRRQSFPASNHNGSNSNIRQIKAEPATAASNSTELPDKERGGYFKLERRSAEEEEEGAGAGAEEGRPLNLTAASHQQPQLYAQQQKIAFKQKNSKEEDEEPQSLDLTTVKTNGSSFSPPLTSGSSGSFPQSFHLLPTQLLAAAASSSSASLTLMGGEGLSAADQLASMLGPDQMAALLGPSWKSRQPRMCQYCQRMFSNKFNLKQHVLNMHTVGREMQCEICNKKVKNKWYLRRHHVTHHGAPLKK